MNKREYLRKAFEAFNAGRIDEETYDAMIQNADIFCEDDDDRDNLPETYAEVEYDDFDDPEAIEGARWDDMNFLHYIER